MGDCTYLQTAEYSTGQPHAGQALIDNWTAQDIACKLAFSLFSLLRTYCMVDILPSSSSSLHAVGTWHYSGSRKLLSSTVMASSTAVGDHSATGNLSTAASLRAASDSNQIGVDLIDGIAAADNGTASVGAGASTSSKVATCCSASALVHNCHSQTTTYDFVYM